jgi:hypothetical protein
MRFSSGKDSRANVSKKIFLFPITNQKKKITRTTYDVMVMVLLEAVHEMLKLIKKD